LRGASPQSSPGSGIPFGEEIAKIAKPTIEISDKVRLNLKNSFRGVEKNSERKKRK
jgi:hypothetical protein